MREILFKGKRIDNGEWVEGFLYKQVGIEDRMYFAIEVIDEAVNAYEVDSSTICQYTGLTDKNGRKIWENDIVKYHFGDDVAPIRFGVYQSCFDSTITGHVGFYVDWSAKIAHRKDLGYWVNMIDCNVIGNIFDNPELLEKAR